MNLKLEEIARVAELEQWQEFAYLLASALADEVHYSQTPSEHSLELLKQARDKFPNSELVKNLDEMEINKLVPVE